MRDLLTALGLVLVIEGLFYAVMPSMMRRAVEVMARIEPQQLRVFATLVAALGVGIVVLARS